MTANPAITPQPNRRFPYTVHHRESATAAMIRQIDEMLARLRGRASALMRIRRELVRAPGAELGAVENHERRF